jgi:hypothetical protein
MDPIAMNDDFIRAAALDALIPEPRDEASLLAGVRNELLDLPEPSGTITNP